MYVNNVYKKDTIMRGGVDVKLRRGTRQTGDVQLNPYATNVIYIWSTNS